MFAQWITYKLTDIFYLLKETRCIFRDNVFDIPDDSVVHHRKAWETKLRYYCVAGNIGTAFV